MKSYFLNTFSPFNPPNYMLITFPSALLLSLFDKYIDISLALLSLYLLLAVLDLATGIYKNVIFFKNAFKSSLFFKKIFSVTMIFIVIGIITILKIEINNINASNSLVVGLNNFMLYIFSVAKVFLIIAFLIWELTSIKENAAAIHWHSLEAIINLAIKPLNIIKEILQNKLKNNKL